MSVSYRNMLAFLRIAESSTFAEAAEKLHLTQPALSSAIKKMESQLGGTLFTRSTRRVQLTPEGEVLLPTARRLVNEWDETVEDMQSLFAMKQGKLTIAAMPSFAESRLPPVLRRYHDTFPNIRLRILDVVMEDVIRCVLTGKAELGFTFEPENTEGLQFYPLFSDYFVAVCYREHPLAKAGSVNWETLVQYPFVGMNRGSAVRKWTEKVGAQAGAINFVAETGQLGSVGQLIAHGLGVSVVPALCTRQMTAKGLVCLPLKGSPLVKQVGVVRSPRHGLSVAAQSLWDQCISQQWPSSAL